MKKEIIQLIITFVITFAVVCLTAQLLPAQTIIHRHSNYTVYERLLGPAGVYDEATKTWKDTCWVGTPGYVEGKAKPKLIRHTIVKQGKQGITFSDSSAYYGLEKYFTDKLNKDGRLEVIYPDGSDGLYHKGTKSKNRESVKQILSVIEKDPVSVQVDGVYEVKERGRK